MSDESQKTPDEEAPAVEEPKPETPEDAYDEDDTPITVEELREELVEMGTRVKEVWFKPVRHFVRRVLNSYESGVDGFLGALEGEKKKKGGD